MRATPDDLVGMVLFARVVEARSFSDAARSLGMSKSAVSARVSRLEEKLGVRLLHRTTRRIALTTDGVRFYERCARVVIEADQAAEIAAGASAEPRGTLRLYAAAGLAQAHLAPVIARYMQAYPDVRIELRLGDRVPDVAVEGFDVAIVVARRLADSGLTVRKLATSATIVAASPLYLRRRGVPWRPEDLVHHECLVHWSLQGEDWRFRAEDGTLATTGRTTLAVDDARFLREAAVAGLGIAVIPELLVREELASGSLVPVLEHSTALEIGVYALHPHAHLAPANVRAFLEHVVAYFRKVGKPEARVLPTKATKTKSKGVAMTQQDVERLRLIVSLYEDIEAAGAARLADIIAAARVLPAAKIPRTTVTMNSRVRLRDDRDEEREVSLVYPWDARRDGVAVVSALGGQLLGATVGAGIRDGDRKLRVAAIDYQPEAAGDHHL